MTEDKNTVTAVKTLIDKSFEQIIDADITLPDYCPEIVRVLQCRAQPQLVKIQTEGTKVICDGYVRFVLLYTSDDPGKLHGFVNTQNFTKVIETGTPLSELTNVSLKSEYVQARATGSRSLIAKSAVSVHICEETFESTTVTLNSQSSDIQLKTEKHTVSIPLGRQIKTFLTEIEVTPEFENITCVLDSYSTAVLDEYKVIDKKVVVKGQILLESSLLCDDGTVHKIAQRTGFSQFVPLDNASADMLCKLKCNILECKEETEQEIDGSVTSLRYLVTGNLYATCYENREVEVALDGYSTLYHTESELQQVIFTRYKPTGHCSCHVSKRIVLDAPIKNIIDQKLELSVNPQKLEQGNNSVPCFGKIHLTAEGEDNQIYVWSKAIDCTVEVPQCEGFDIQLDTACLSWDHVGVKCEQNSAYVSFDVLLQGYCMESSSICCLKQLRADTDQPKQRDDSVAMVIYFANSGESIWDIAKHYNTTVKQIAKANALTGETIEAKQVILIPMVAG